VSHVNDILTQCEYIFTTRCVGLFVVLHKGLPTYYTHYLPMLVHSVEAQAYIVISGGVLIGAAEDGRSGVTILRSENPLMGEAFIIIHGEGVELGKL
jgi:hypothetical protein